MADFVKVASSDEISPGECKVAQVDDKAIALYNVNTEDSIAGASTRAHR